MADKKISQLIAAAALAGLGALDLRDPASLANWIIGARPAKV